MRRPGPIPAEEAARPEPARRPARGRSADASASRVSAAEPTAESADDTAVDELGLPDEFLNHATREQILDDAGLSAAKIAHDVVAQVLGTRIPVARPSADTGAIWTVGAPDGEPQER